MLLESRQLTLSLVELHAHAFDRAKIPFLKVVADYREFFDGIISVTESVALEAVRLRGATTDRFPTMDFLVHRDPHFAALPEGQLRQLALPAG